MADTSNLYGCYEDTVAYFEAKNYLYAAVESYWAMQYCRYGDPYGLSAGKLQEIENIVSKIYSKSIKKLPQFYELGHDKVERSGSLKQEQLSAMAIAQHISLPATDCTVNSLFTQRHIDGSIFHLPSRLKLLLWLQKTNELKGHDKILCNAAFSYDDLFTVADLIDISDGKAKIFSISRTSSCWETMMKLYALQFYVIDRNCEIEDFFVLEIEHDNGTGLHIAKKSVFKDLVEMQCGIKVNSADKKEVWIDRYLK